MSASRSWLSRESFRTRRPKTMIGTTTTNSSATMIPASVGLDQIISPSAPTKRRAFLSPTEMLEPMRVWISVVSLDSRDSTSPARSVSKKTGS